jgi:pseudouridine-5'-phosphate glycosidase
MTMVNPESLVIAPEIDRAMASGRPVVALESALITHGFAYPENVAITRRMIRAIEDAGAVAAVVGVWQGTATVGLDDAQMETLASAGAAVKVSLRDLPLSGVRGTHGGTTVAATAWLARLAGIQVFATGGIGGIHRGHPEDVSADLPTLSRTPIVVVCAGAKSILDLPRTLEYLETWGVPVVGWRTQEFPAFYSRRSGLPVDLRVEDAEAVARLYQTQRDHQLPQSLLVAVPVAEADALPFARAERWIEQAVADAEQQGVVGKAVTPFVLARMVQLSDGQARRANESLLVGNARVAAEIARALR